MTDRVDLDERIAGIARGIVRRLESRVDEATRAVEHLLAREIAELSDDPQLQQLLRDTVSGNVVTFFAVFRHDIAVRQAQPPSAALEYARRLAQRDISANALIRAYRLGHQTALRIVLDEVRAAEVDPELGLRIAELVTAASFDYVDWISQRVVEVYQDERERWLANRNGLRASRVRELLDAGCADAEVDARSAAIGYPLRRRHLGMVVWRDAVGGGDELRVLERFVHRLAEEIGAAGPPLFIPVDEGIGWAWLPLDEVSAVAAVARIRDWVSTVADAPRLALGESAVGVAGFRRTHRQARDARLVAAGGADARAVTAFGDAGLGMAALLGADPAAAAVWVGEVLGPLASATESDGRLRETLRVFLGAGGSYTAAGELLGLHYNSVKYRVQRAVARRGRSITEDRLDVEVALVLADWLGAAVLS